MGKFIDLTGQKFGRLTVVERAENSKNGKPKWRCVCDCGNEIVVSVCNLRNGHTKSCGCYRRDCSVKRNTTHGECKTRLYRIWIGIKTRCYNENDENYNNYGNRNISMCEEWRNSFETFRDWALENGYANRLTIDRIDVDGNYEPSNCRWVNMKEQQNNRTNNHLLSYNGKTQTISQWANEVGLRPHTLQARINQYGWTVEEALSTPLGETRNNHDSI